MLLKFGLFFLIIDSLLCIVWDLNGVIAINGFAIFSEDICSDEDVECVVNSAFDILFFFAFENLKGLLILSKLLTVFALAEIYFIKVSATYLYVIFFTLYTISLTFKLRTLNPRMLLVD